MAEPHIFIVRLSAERRPTHGFLATVRAVDSAQTTIARTPEELATSLLSALSPAPGPRWRRDTGAVAGLAIGALLLGASLWSGLGAFPLPSATTIAFVLLAATGLLSGFLSGLLGIGGALVVVPAMYLLLPLLGVPAERVPHVAVGSSLLAMIPTALAATIAQHRRGGIDTRWLRRLGPGMVGGAAVGATLAMQLNGPVLSLLFAAQSFYYGWGLMCRAPGAPSGSRARLLAICAAAPGWTAGPAIAAFCACAGMGGGSLSVPYLTAQRLSLLPAAATSCALNLCIAIGGSVAMSVLETHAPGAPLSFSWQAAALVGGSAVLSARYGVALAHRLPVALFRRLLGLVTLFGALVLTGRTLWVCL